MLKKTILSAIILVTSYISYSQFSFTISGPTDVAEGFTVDYTVNFINKPPTNANFTITIVNGILIPNTGLPDYEHIKVKWNCQTPNGSSITLSEATTPYTFTLPVNVQSYLTSTTYCSVAFPEKQNLNYGQSPAQLDVTYCSPYCDATYTYQWQVGNVPIGVFPQEPTSWTNITGATSKTYQPPTYNVDCIKAYRRKTSYSDVAGVAVDKFSSTAVISTFDFLNPGTISWNNTFSNGVPGITQTPATGGLCDGFNYQYTWEKSFDGNNYSSIGAIGTNNPNYPAGVQLSGTCYLRRRVDCGGQTLYTIPVQIIVQPLNPGTISGGGTYTFNTIPTVTQTPASGSVCTAVDYIYTWERSVDNGPWVIFGTGIDYPANAGVIATCQIRRKVHCVFEDAYTLPISITMLPYNSPNTENLNYVRVNEITRPGVQSWLQADALFVGDKFQTTQYFDGFDRLIQTVSKQSSFTNISGAEYSDIAKVNVYDVFGREQYRYLPFVANNAGGNNSISDGKFKTNPLDQQAIFGQSQYPGENYYYSKINFESSPLSRVTEVYAEGNSWVGTENNTTSTRKNIKNENYVNTDIDEVQIWNVTNNSNNTSQGAFANYTSLGAYPAGQLYKNILINEDGKQTIEFRNKAGKIILIKKQLTATIDNGAGDGYPGWICTYYVYDDMDVLRAVFQPKAVEWLFSHNWSFTNTPAEANQVLSELVFRYEYDNKKHLIKKQFPGGAEIWIVYDSKDRVVLTQDANQRISHNWTYTQYDDANRPFVSGLITDNSNFNNLNYHLQQASTNSSYPDLNLYSSEELTRNFYDDYKWRSAWGNPLSAVYNNNYDSYFSQSSYTIWPYVNSISPNKCSIHKQSTGSRVKILGTSSYLFSVVFYDEKGRVLQTQTQNITGGTDISTIQYTWSGKPFVTILKQEIGGTVNPQTHIVKTSVVYDKLYREVEISKSINSNISNQNYVTPTVAILKNEYNLLGKLVKKKLGQKKDASGNYTSTPIESLSYDYNIRGWLLGVNRAYIKNQAVNYFGFELAYDNTNNIMPGQSYSNPQYTANISGTTWRGIGDNEIRKYDFNYDESKRLLGADFKQFDGNNFVTSPVVNYSMKVGDGLTSASAYDLNGNIISMQQFGLKLNSSPLIDDLHYTYENSGRSNKLKNVIDRSNDVLTKLGDFRTLSQHPQYLAKLNTLTDPNTIVDYTYDANSNLKIDNNKYIVNGSNNGIEYNYLNIPSKIFFSNGAKGSVEFIYNALGQKLQKIVTDFTVNNKKIVTTSSYISGFVYESKNTLALPTGPSDPSDYTNKLLCLTTETGRVRVGDLTLSNPFVFDYFIKDNLANTRMVLTDEVQKDVYPAATLEGDISNSNSAIGYENNFYTINTSNVVDNSEATGINTPSNTYYNNNGIANPYPPGNSGNTNVNNASTKLYKLLANTSGGQTGLGIVLKVMSGDRIDILGKSYYFQNNTGSQNYPITFSDIVSGLFGSPSSIAGTKGPTAIEVNNNPVLTNLITSFLNDPSRSNGGLTKPKAYINWILFDENFKMVSGNFARVHDPNSVWDHYNDLVLQDIPVSKSGFLYVYASNESPVKVFFDNLQVVHRRGPVLEENHYYPFGVLMTGISSKAAGKFENLYKYNSKELQKNEFSDGNSLEWYDYGLREYDQQIGRFFRVDPLVEDYPALTPYQYASNDPITNIDIDGLEGGSSVRGWLVNSSGLQNYDGPGGSKAFAKSMANQMMTADPYLGAIDMTGRLLSKVAPLILFEFVPIGGGTVMEAGTVGAFERAAARELTEAAAEKGAQETAAKAIFARDAANAAAIRTTGEITEAMGTAIRTETEAELNLIKFQATAGGRSASEVFSQTNVMLNPEGSRQLAAEWLQAEGTINAQQLGWELKPGARTIPTPDGSKYSVAFETKLPSNMYIAPRTEHNIIANKALRDAMNSDPVFASTMSDLGISIPKDLRRSPSNWTWHHDAEPGIMQLVPRSQHDPGTIFQNVLHPGGFGGWSIWGIR